MVHQLEQAKVDERATARAERDAAESALRERLDATEATVRSEREKNRMLEAELVGLKERVARTDGRLELLEEENIMRQTERRRQEEQKIRDFLSPRDHTFDFLTKTKA